MSSNWLYSFWPRESCKILQTVRKAAHQAKALNRFLWSVLEITRPCGLTFKVWRKVSRFAQNVPKRRERRTTKAYKDEIRDFRETINWQNLQELLRGDKTKMGVKIETKRKTRKSWTLEVLALRSSLKSDVMISQVHVSLIYTYVTEEYILGIWT
jgi:hypothetical protein